MPEFVLKNLDQKLSCGHVVAMQVIYPATSAPEDVLAAKNAEDEVQWSFLDLSIKGHYSHHFTKYLKDRDVYPEMNEEDLHYLKENHPDFIGVCCE